MGDKVEAVVSSKVEECTMVEDGSTALVPFSYASPFHDSKEQETRLFDYDGQLVTIHQSWAARRRHIDSKKGDSDSVDAKSGGGEVETSVAHANVGLGFGASLYPSAVVLADYIYRHPAVVHGKVCVELGAGLGLASIVAVLAGAKRVYVTDGNGELLELTRANVEGNLRDRPHLLDRIHVVEHMWGDFGGPKPGQEALAKEAPVDLVFGADIAACPYAPALRELVASIEYFAGADTDILIGYQPRNVLERVFFSRMKRSFEAQEPVPHTELLADFTKAHKDLQLLRFRRKVPPADSNE